MGKKPPPAIRLNAIQTALRRLAVEQGPRSRKNARAAVKHATRQMLKLMDRLYCAPPRKVGSRRHRTDAEKTRKLVADGWSSVFPSLLPVYVAAGVSVRQTDQCIWVPQWAELIHKHRPKKLRGAVANVQLRKALITEIALTGTRQGA